MQTNQRRREMEKYSENLNTLDYPNISPWTYHEHL